MQKSTLFIVVLVLAGCASTREESAIAFQQQLPQLVADCNLAFRDGTQFSVGIVAVSEGIDACDRLAKERSLSLADPVAVNSYQSYNLGRAQRAASCYPGSGSTCPPLASYTPALQQQTTPFVCSGLPACP